MEPAAPAPTPRVRIYLDDRPEPIVDEALPADVRINTLDLVDGPHRLLVRAIGQNGREGHEEIRFNVQNGPGRRRERSSTRRFESGFGRATGIGAP